MKAILGVVTLALMTASCEACALGSLASVTVIDRDSGAVLNTHYSRGEYWVARPTRRHGMRSRCATIQARGYSRSPRSMA